MAIEKNYYTIDPEGKLQCVKCGVLLEKGKAKFMYLDNGFPVELPVCPVCGHQLLVTDTPLSQFSAMTAEEQEAMKKTWSYLG